MPRIVEDRGELFALLKRLVDSQEQRYPADTRYRVESLPDDILQGMMDGIVGFEIMVSRIEAAAKMSQNRSERDYRNIVDQLGKQADPDGWSPPRWNEERRHEGHHGCPCRRS